ncbi:MAG TPA: sel1 repeat family protein [Nitrospinaceae bacterium]|nr:sel1 repeat family protein [Nitrospinaceae bacterium]
MGQLYYEGHGVPQDFGEAIKWYRLSAEQKHPLAQHNLRAMYFEGRGVPQDY